MRRQHYLITHRTGGWDSLRDDQVAIVRTGSDQYRGLWKLKSCPCDQGRRNSYGLEKGHNVPDFLRRRRKKRERKTIIWNIMG